MIDTSASTLHPEKNDLDRIYGVYNSNDKDCPATVKAATMIATSKSDAEPIDAVLYGIRPVQEDNEFIRKTSELIGAFNRKADGAVELLAKLSQRFGRMEVALYNSQACHSRTLINGGIKGMQ